MVEADPLAFTADYYLSVCLDVYVANLLLGIDNANPCMPLLLFLVHRLDVKTCDAWCFGFQVCKDPICLIVAVIQVSDVMPRFRNRKRCFNDLSILQQPVLPVPEHPLGPEPAVLLHAGIQFFFRYSNHVMCHVVPSEIKRRLSAGSKVKLVTSSMLPPPDTATVIKCVLDEWFFTSNKWLFPLDTAEAAVGNVAVTPVPVAVKTTLKSDVVSV